MKKIINGRKYDTETAKAVGYWDNGKGGNDFGYVIESLYRKKTGEFFLAGEGGAASKYSRSCGLNEWCGGSNIFPLTEAEAREWCEEHLDVEDYEAIFGEVEE